MLWIREEKILSGSDDGPASQRCRELNLDGICGDVRREDPEDSPQTLLAMGNDVKNSFPLPGLSLV